MALTKVQIETTKEAQTKIAGYAEDLTASIKKMDQVVSELESGEGWDDTAKNGAETLIASIKESEAKLAAIQECIANLPTVLDKIVEAYNTEITGTTTEGGSV